jgi:hypothetical protein
VSSPFFIGGFFAPQQILQLAWLRELWRTDDEVEGTSLTLVPYYALGGGWGDFLTGRTKCWDLTILLEGRLHR